MEGAQQRLASYSFLVAPVPPILNTDYQTLCRWDAQCWLGTSRGLLHNHGDVRLRPCGRCSWKWKHYFCVFHHGSSPSRSGRYFSVGVRFMQSKMESWFVQLGEASPLLARTGWPVPGWRNTTDLHETQHTINGHLLWITHSKMSTRLLAATVFCFFPAPGARRRGVTIRKPPQLHMSMHHSWAGNDAHCENDARKNRKIMAVKRMIVCFRFKELSVKSSILIRQPCVTVCPGPSM